MIQSPGVESFVVPIILQASDFLIGVRKPNRE